MNKYTITISPLFFLILLTGWALLLSTPAYSTSYYVDNIQGDDTNNGDRHNPWKTIAKVNNTQFSPGDKILFAKNRTWDETLVISSSGIEGKYIEFSSYGTGNLPVIDGSDPLTGTWLQEGVNVYSTDNHERHSGSEHDPHPQSGCDSDSK